MINPSTVYPTQVATGDAAFPLGRPRNDITVGDGSGTPLEEKWVQDVFGFFQAVMAASYQSPSGTTERVGASQVIDGLKYITTQQAELDYRRKVMYGTWIRRPLPSGWAVGTLAAIKRVNSIGLYIGVGIGASSVSPILTSPDGIEWTVRTAASSFLGSLMCLEWHGSGSFAVVAGAGGEIQTSTNGTAWTHRAKAGTYSGTFAGAAYGLNPSDVGMIVLVGTSGEIQTSPDGITWTKRTQAGAYAGNFNAVCYSETLSLWVAVGTSGEIQTSPDGITWTKRTQAGAYAGNFASVRSVGTYSMASQLLMAVGTSGEIQTSPDGITWTKRTPDSAAAASFTGVSLAGYHAVICGLNGELQISEDCVTWRKRYGLPQGGAAYALEGTPYQTFAVVNDSLGSSVWHTARMDTW